MNIKSVKAHLVCFEVFSWLLEAPESRFKRFISQRLVLAIGNIKG